MILIIILAILSTIAFISLQGYFADARDAKRLSDITNLINLVDTERINGASLSDLMVFDHYNALIINNEYVKSSEGVLNFQKTKNPEKNFQDPKTGENYPFAIIENSTKKSDGRKMNYNFYEFKTISEVKDEEIIKGNYNKINKEADSDNLFIDGEGIPVIDNSFAITITANSDSKMYDGTPLTNSGFTTSHTSNYITIIATVQGSQTEVGSSANEVVAYKILVNNIDMTSFFKNVTDVDGTLTVTRRGGGTPPPPPTRPTPPTTP